VTARGHIRWLRPDFQIPKLAAKAPKPDAAQQAEAELAMDAPAAKPAWPTDGLDQIRLVRETLDRAAAPVNAEALSAQFRGGRNRADRVRTVLAHMVETGMVRELSDAPTKRYFLPG
jgi:hypothetical protein